MAVKNETYVVNNRFYCPSCGWFDYPMSKGLPNNCPNCGTQIAGLRCTRCGHQWRLRRRTLPCHCPKCCSPYYSRQYLQEMRGEPVPKGRRKKSTDTDDTEKEESDEKI